MRKWLSDNKVFLKAFCFGMAVLILIFCLPFSSNAVDTSDYTTLSNQPFPADSSWGSDNRVFIGKNSGGTSLYYCGAPENSFGFLFTADGHNSLCFCSTHSFSCSLRLSATATGGGYGINTSNFPVDGDTGLHYFVFQGSSSSGDSDAIPVSQINLPIFNSLSQGLSAVRSQIDNPGGGGSEETPTRFVFDYDLPPGNILYIRKGIDSDEWDSDLILTAEFPLQSDIGSDHFVRSFYVGDAESLPSSETVFPDDLGNLLSEVYLGVGEPKTALGQSRYGYLHSSELASIYPYLVIYNPVRTGVYDTMSSTEQNMYANVNLHVHLEAAAAAYAWPLTSNFTIAGGVTGTTTLDPAESEFQITYDTETQTWDTVDPEGDPGTLIPGGNTIIDTSSTSIKGLLQDFLSKFTRIFEKSYDAISGLINAGGAFISKLGGIFAWLPSPVYSVLSSALLLVVVIGTLKVLL